jgi:2-keto-4-pentenoate hydratase/2-oxohepta-3-ene-1,7-dioic acid hydratase in catechol pathway
MKIATVLYQGQEKVGVVEGEKVLLLAGAEIPSTMKELIAGGAPVLDAIRMGLKAGSFSGVRLEQVQFLAPIKNPGKIMAIGLNYYDHCREQNAPIPARPIVFAKFNTSLAGPGDVVTWSAQLTQQVDLEVELGVVFGRRARRVDEAEALDYIFGYTVLNDVSARDLQYGDKQFIRGKSLDGFCPTGPWIVTADEIPDPQSLHLTSRINDFVMQDSSTREMIFSVRNLVSYLSQAFTLEPGDLLATGTPNGVGMYRKPQVFLQDGDVMTLDVEKVGRLVNPTHILVE